MLKHYVVHDRLTHSNTQRTVLCSYSLVVHASMCLHPTNRTLSILPALPLQFQNPVDRRLEPILESLPPSCHRQPLPFQSLSLVEPLGIEFAGNLLRPDQAVERIQRQGHGRSRRRSKIVPHEDGATQHSLGAHLGPRHGVLNVRGLAVARRLGADDGHDVHGHGARGLRVGIRGVIPVRRRRGVSLGRDVDAGLGGGGRRRRRRWREGFVGGHLAAGRGRTRRARVFRGDGERLGRRSGLVVSDQGVAACGRAFGVGRVWVGRT